MRYDVEYFNMVRALTKSGDDIFASMTPKLAHNVHMAMGIAGEVGELLDAIKKEAIYGKPLDRENVIEELGDIEFFLEGLRQGFKITREEVIKANTSKLSVRYKSGTYSNAAAIDRVDKQC